jgi:hypothetical protein
MKGEMNCHRIIRVFIARMGSGVNFAITHVALSGFIWIYLVDIVAHVTE